MRLNVHFYKAEKDIDCGPIALQMIARYFGKYRNLKEISELERQLDSGLVWTAGIARAAKKLEFDVKIISKSNFSHEEDDIEYYKKYSDNEGMMVLKELINEIKVLGG